MKKGFTLIELLVVIAIIAILAAILFPVFAQAKAAAKKTTDLSNQKQISLGLIMYSADNDDVLPSAYFHRAFNPALGGTAGGYVHWSAMVQPYVKNLDMFVSPGDQLQGHAPTCFASANNNSGRGFPGGQQPDRCPNGGQVPGVPTVGGSIVDDQVPRLSYTVNSAVIPRLRNILDQTVGGIRVVSVTALDSPANTIYIAGLTSSLQCLNGQSLGTGLRNSSHRSTNAVTRDAANTTPYLGENTDGTASPLYALNFQQIVSPARNIFQICQQGQANMPLITYTSAFRWNNQGDNYGFADGSAKFRAFAQTLAVNNYQWGNRMYTAGGTPILDPISGVQVQN